LRFDWRQKRTLEGAAEPGRPVEMEPACEAGIEFAAAGLL
jgi:hypothetical protein